MPFFICKITKKFEHILGRALILLFNDDTSPLKHLPENEAIIACTFHASELCTEVYKTMKHLNLTFLKEIASSKSPANRIHSQSNHKLYSTVDLIKQNLALLV